jgi:hypothetical protein
MDIVCRRGCGCSELMKARETVRFDLFQHQAAGIRVRGRAGSAGKSGGFLRTASTKSSPCGALTAAIHAVAPFLRYHSSALRVRSSGNRNGSFAPVRTGSY